MPWGAPRWRSARAACRRHRKAPTAASIAASDFSAGAVTRLYENFERGMIADYLAHRAERDAALSLVTMDEPA